MPQRHLARFVVEVVERLDLSELKKSYRGSGSASHHTAVLRGPLVYGYARRVFSSRRPTTRWPFASARATSIPITTRLRISASAS